jgi:predicted PurR-regulated permease PerM
MMHIDWKKGRDIFICLICIGIILWASWSVLTQFVDAIIILLLSMTIAFLLHPATNFLEEKCRIPRFFAALIVYVFVLGSLGWLTYLLIFSLISQAQIFATQITNFAVQLPTTFRSTIDFLEKDGHIPNSNINDALSQIQSQATEFAKTLASDAINLVVGISSAFLNILLVIVLSFYMTLDGQRIRSNIFSIIPQRSLPSVQIFDEALSRVVGNYLRGQLVLATIVGVATGLFCVFTGLGDYALICGVLAFLFETIPMLGPLLASITPIILSLLLSAPFPRTFVLIGLFVALQTVESNILGPRIVGHAVGLHPVAAIFALLVGTKLFGLFGALIATPLVAAGWVVIVSIYRSAKGETAEQIMAKKHSTWNLRRNQSSPDQQAEGGGDEASLTDEKCHKEEIV